MTIEASLAGSDVVNVEPGGNAEGTVWPSPVDHSSVPEAAVVSSTMVVAGVSASVYCECRCFCSI